MPEAYTHISIARQALEASTVFCESKAAFEMGANGPDPFISYRALTKHPPFPMRVLGERLHHEHCGAFLCALVTLCTTAAQRSYTMGFLSHNAADAILHPYVKFITSAGQCYNRPNGHGFFEIALDSTLYKKDRGTRCVAAKDTAPELSPLEIAEISVLIQKAYLKVFGEELPIEGIADSFHDFRFLHLNFVSKWGVKKIFAFLADTFILHNPGFAVSHMSPAKLSKHLPDKWCNPYTNDIIEGGAFELLRPSIQVSNAFLKSATGYWNGQLSLLQLTRLIGDHSYITGLESEPEDIDERSASEANHYEKDETGETFSAAIPQENALKN